MAMTTERIFFIAEGKAHDICEAFMKERDEVRDQWYALASELGASNVWSNGRLIQGFSFDESKTREQGWRKSKDGRFYVPLRNTKDGRRVGRLMNQLPSMPTAGALGTRLNCDEVILPGRGFSMRMLSVGLEKLGDQWVVSVPVDSDGKHQTPEDCTPIKHSEYWRMKENAADDS